MNLTSVQTVYAFADSVALVSAMALAIVLFRGHRLRAESYVLRNALAIAALLGLRIVDRFSDATIVNIALELVVATLPLLTLLMAESLVRKHAPVWIKLACMGGSLGIVLLAIFRFNQIDAVRIPVMGAILITCLALVLGFVILRDRQSLMANENERIASWLLGFAILIPFATSDFLDNRYEQLVGMGAIGILILTLAIVRGVTGRPKISGYVVDLAMAAAIAIVLILATSVLIGLSSRQQLELGVSFAAFGLAIMCFGHLRRLVHDGAVLPFSSIMAHARTGSIDEFLRDLRQHRLLKSSVLIEGDDLQSKVPPEVIDLLKHSPVVSRPVLENLRNKGGISANHEAALSLLTASQMSHVVSVGISPPRVLLCEAAMLGTDRVERDDLLLLSQMALLIERNESHD